MLNSISLDLEFIRTHRHSMTAAQIHDRARRIREACEAAADGEAAPNPSYARILRYGRAFFSRWEVFLERQLGFAPDDSQLATAFTMDERDELRSEYVKMYQKLVGAEISLCSPDTSTRVCHIGCGPMPLTLLMWHKYTRSQITGIDIDPDAVTKARQVLATRLDNDTLSYEPDKIGFETVSGSDYDYSPFNIILLSSTIQPKDVVFSRILETARPGVMVLERVPFGIWRHMTKWDDDHPAGFVLTGAVRTAYLEVRRYQSAT